LLFIHKKKIKIILLPKSNGYRTENKSDIYSDFILNKLIRYHYLFFCMKSTFKLYLEHEHLNYNIETEAIIVMEPLYLGNNILCNSITTYYKWLDTHLFKHKKLKLQ